MAALRPMSDVRAAETFTESGRFAFHTANDREGVERRLAALGRQHKKAVIHFND